MRHRSLLLSVAPHSPVSKLQTVVRCGLVLIGMMMPLNIPFAIPVPQPDRVLGWTGSPLPSGGVLVTKTQWYANAAGLLPGDVVVRVDGAEATSTTIERSRRESRPGDVVSLVVERRGRTIELYVPVVEQTISYSSYRWYRFVLAVGAWFIGMGLIVWRGSRPAALALGAALLFVAPVTLPVVIQRWGVVLEAANILWQLQAAAYRIFFPALLLHFLVLNTGRPRWLDGRAAWAVLYLIALAVPLVTTDLLREPLAWRTPGLEQNIRHGSGLLFELLALGVTIAILRNISDISAPGRPVQWLVFTVFLFLLSGIALSTVSLVPRATPAALEFLRQIKSITLLLLIAMAGLYLLALGQSEAEEWRYRRSLASSASVVLTALYGFAVAGAAAIVHSLELRLGEVEGLLFGAIFLAAIVFSPVLGWAREMVDRRMFARWSELEVRSHTFVEGISAELTPERISERVSRELPPLLDIASARLVLARELVEAWDASDPLRLASLPQAVLAEQSSRRNEGDEVVIPVYRPDGEILGILRLGPRLDGRRFEPPEYAVLRTLAQGVAAALRNTEAYVKLRGAQQELDNAERIASLGTLAGGLAHEIKNPLASLKMGLYLMERDGGDGDKLRRIQRDVQRIDDLVSGLLRFTSAGVPEPREPVDVAHLVAKCVADTRNRADDQGAVVVERYPQQQAIALGGRDQLRLVISNLLVNALDAVGNGGMIEVEVRMHPDTVELTVDDSGPGIPLDQRSRIFDLNFSTKPRGSGLGLALARRETERLGGTIEVAEAIPHGTRLRVVLPRVNLC